MDDDMSDSTQGVPVPPRIMPSSAPPKGKWFYPKGVRVVSPLSETSGKIYLSQDFLNLGNTEEEKKENSFEMEEQEPVTDDVKVATEETSDIIPLSSKISLPTTQPSFQAILDEVDAELASFDEHENDKKKLEAKTFDLSDLENNSELDTDLEDEDERVVYDVTGKTMYLETCKNLGVVPVSYFLRYMSGEEIKMKHHGLGPLGAKAMAVPLVTNTTVLTLDLEDNGIEGNGGVYIADMLKENCYITELNLSHNKLGSLGGCAICDMLLQNINVTKLTLQGNEFRDKDAEYFAKAILENQTLRELDLSHNEFGEDAGMVLSYAIGENETLESVDLSWNHLRGNGAIAVCDGVKNNARLKHFNISWNGLGNKGALAVAEILKFNRTLTSLDISSNRITTEGAMVLSKGIDPNETLKTFKMGLNPIGTMGALVMLNGVNNERSILDTLDLSNILIDKEFKKIHEEMGENGRNLVVIHGGLLGDYVIKGTPKIKVELGSNEDLHKLVTKKSSALDDFMKNDPMAILKAYVEKKQLRLVDFFNQFDKDKNYKISMDEFKRGIVMASIGLTAEQIESLLHRLDSSGVSDKDGMIDYRELVTGTMQMTLEKRRLMQQEMDARNPAIIAEKLEVLEAMENKRTKSPFGDVTLKEPDFHSSQLSLSIARARSPIPDLPDLNTLRPKSARNSGRNTPVNYLGVNELLPREMNHLALRKSPLHSRSGSRVASRVPSPESVVSIGDGASPIGVTTLPIGDTTSQIDSNASPIGGTASPDLNNSPTVKITSVAHTDIKFSP